MRGPRLSPFCVGARRRRTIQDFSGCSSGLRERASLPLSQEVVMRKIVLAAMFVAWAAPLHAQSGTEAPAPTRSLELAGPRFGVTMLSEGVIKKLAERNIDVGSTISQ